MNELDMNFDEIIKIVETRKNNAFRKVNKETIKMYWEFGEYVSNRLVDSEWGDIIEGLGHVFTNKTRVKGTYFEKEVEDNDDWTTITYYKEIKVDEVLLKTRFIVIDKVLNKE